MNQTELTHWLLNGDVSIQYQVCRDLLSEERADLQKRIATEGWGAEFLSKRKPGGHWGMKFYQPKWISSHYTLLDLRNICIDPNHVAIRASIDMIAEEEKGEDGGINPSSSIKNSDVCVNGMFLNYASYFKIDEEKLKSVVDLILSQRMKDGGFNCHLNRCRAVHSSLHTTISALEGITEYEKNGYSYRLDELKDAERTSREFILLHHLFRSDKTGEIIKKDFLKFYHPPRWYYDVLRAMDYFQYSETGYDDRMKDALDLILEKRTKDGQWKLPSKHPGQVHFEMEPAGQLSRWNTLRALRVLKKYVSREIEEMVVNQVKEKMKD